MWGPRECPCAGLGLGGWSSQGRLPEGAAVQAKTENLMGVGSSGEENVLDGRTRLCKGLEVGRGQL